MSSLSTSLLSHATGISPGSFAYTTLVLVLVSVLAIAATVVILFLLAVMDWLSR